MKMIGRAFDLGPRIPCIKCGERRGDFGLCHQAINRITTGTTLCSQASSSPFLSVDIPKTLSCTAQKHSYTAQPVNTPYILAHGFSTRVRWTAAIDERRGGKEQLFGQLVVHCRFTSLRLDRLRRCSPRRLCCMYLRLEHLIRARS